MPLRVALSLLLLTPPLTGVAIILFTHYRPRLRSTIAFGTSFLLLASSFAILGTANAIFHARNPVVLWFVTGLPTLCVALMMRQQWLMQTKQSFIPNDSWDKFWDI